MTYPGALFLKVGLVAISVPSGWVGSLQLIEILTKELGIWNYVSTEPGNLIALAIAALTAAAPLFLILESDGKQEQIEKLQAQLKQKQ